MILRVNKHIFYGFIIVCLSTLFICNGIAFKKNSSNTYISPSITPIPSISSSVINLQTQQLTSSYSDNEGYLPIKSTVPVIPLAVSQEEILMREKQLKIAQENKREAEGLFRAGVGNPTDIRMAEYFILSHKIRLLQAKQLLQLKQQQQKNKNSFTKL